jgi:hypothetical protein
MIAPMFAHEFCRNHPRSPSLGYLQACADADARLRRREIQWLCGKCSRWIWSEFMTNFDGAISEHQWKLQKRAKP